jgi:hypothetical protein
MNLARSDSARRTWLVVMLTAGLAAALPWAAAEEPAAVENGEGPGDHLLPVGKECVVVIDSGSGSLEVGGRLEQANDRWLVLHAEIEGRSDSGVPMLNKVPYVTRLFKNTGIARSADDYWIPRERVLYVRATANRETAGDADASGEEEAP